MPIYKKDLYIFLRQRAGALLTLETFENSFSTSLKGEVDDTNGVLTSLCKIIFLKDLDLVEKHCISLQAS
jgi:hypothetical protein